MSIPNKSPSLNRLELFLQILQHFEIFHLMGVYVGKKWEKHIHVVIIIH